MSLLTTIENTTELDDTAAKSHCPIWDKKNSTQISAVGCKIEFAF